MELIPIILVDGCTLLSLIRFSLLAHVAVTTCCCSVVGNQGACRVRRNRRSYRLKNLLVSQIEKFSCLGLAAVERRMDILLINVGQMTLTSNQSCTWVG